MLNLFFWVSIFLISYTYVLYPLLLRLIAKNRKWKYVDSNLEPQVSILIPIHNEEQVIQKKIESILENGYPLEKIEIIVFSDASTDLSKEIVQNLAQKYPFIKFHEHSKRMGKSFVVNQMVNLAKFEILLLTDANILLTKNAIRNNVRNYTYANVGSVGSLIKNTYSNQDDNAGYQEKEYVSFENKIKYLEGLIWGCTIAPFGACFSFRKQLFKPIPNRFLVDDFFITSHILQQKQACILDEESICIENLSGIIAIERKRRRRISAGNFQNLSYFIKYLNPLKPFGFCFWSHKGLRWLTPFLLLSLIILNLLLFKTHLLYQILFALQFVFYCIPLTGLNFKDINWVNKLSKFANYFILMNISLLEGFYDYCKGIKVGYWDITKR